MDEYRAELLRLVKGSPQPGVGVQGLAERMGLSEAETRALIADLIAEGRLQRDGERLLVVEPAASAAREDTEIP